MIWKDAYGFEGQYQVSEFGDIRSVDRTHFIHDTKGRKGSRTHKGRVIKPRLHEFGYLMVTLSVNGKSFTRTVHKLVAETFIGPRLGLLVRHVDGDPKNNHYSNLCYGTQAENMADAMEHGTVQQGEACYNAVLTSEIVECIRNKRASGSKPSELAIEFGISEVAVHKITTGKTWLSAPGPIVTGRSNNKLSEDDRARVLKASQDGAKLSDICARFSISKTQARNIINGNQRDKN